MKVAAAAATLCKRVPKCMGELAVQTRHLAASVHAPALILELQLCTNSLNLLS
jgi:hypothetical protein